MSSIAVDSNAATISSTTLKKSQSLRDVSKVLPSTSKNGIGSVKNIANGKGNEMERKRSVAMTGTKGIKKQKVERKDPLMPLDIILSDMDNFVQQKKKPKKKDESDDDSSHKKLQKSTTPVPGTFKIPTFNDLTRMENDNSIVYSFLERNPPGVNEMVLAYKMLKGRVDAFHYGYFDKTRLKPANLQIAEAKGTKENISNKDNEAPQEEAKDTSEYEVDEDQSTKAQADRIQQVKAYYAKYTNNRPVSEASKELSEDAWISLGRLKPEYVFKYIDQIIAANSKSTAMKSPEGNSDRNSVAMDISSDDGSVKEDAKKPIQPPGMTAIPSQQPSTSTYSFSQPITIPQYCPNPQPPPSNYSEPGPSHASVMSNYPGSSIQQNIPSHNNHGYQQMPNITPAPAVPQLTQQQPMITPPVVQSTNGYNFVAQPTINSVPQPSGYQMNTQSLINSIPQQDGYSTTMQSSINSPTKAIGHVQLQPQMMTPPRPNIGLGPGNQVAQPSMGPNGFSNVQSYGQPPHRQELPQPYPNNHQMIQPPHLMMQQQQRMPMINPPLHNQMQSPVRPINPMPPPAVQQNQQQPKIKNSPSKNFKDQKKVNGGKTPKNKKNNQNQHQPENKKPDININMDIIRSMPPPPIPKIIQEQRQQESSNNNKPSLPTPPMQSPMMPRPPQPTNVTPDNGSIMRTLFSVLKPGVNGASQEPPRFHTPVPPPHFRHPGFQRPPNTTPGFRPNRPRFQRHPNNKNRF